MKPIHAFWFVAEAAAETIAIWPAPPICFASRSTSLAPIPCGVAWLMNRLRQAGASESYVTTVIPFCIAEFSVGQSADASVADTSRMFAPLVIAAWMAGIWEAGVAAVPLVSVPDSLRAFRAAIAPPDFALSEVVKYELPRFFGMTKTFRPVFIGAAADAIAAPKTQISASAVPVASTRFLREPVITRVLSTKLEGLLRTSCATVSLIRHRPRGCPGAAACAANAYSVGAAEDGVSSSVA